MQNQPEQTATANAADQTYEIAKDAYVYAYPLIVTYATIRQLSNFAEPLGPEGGTHGPPNQFHHARVFPDPDHKIVIRENVDTYTTRSGVYGVDYDYRAAVANFGLGENLPQDAVYPSLTTDSEGRSLDGDNTYVLHFDKDALPPVDAFWSVTAYDAEGYFIPNALHRQSIGDRSGLATNPDGSLDLFIQADSPGSDKEANWLPVATAPFNLLMRLYSPREDVLDGSWAPPLVKRR